MRLARDHLTILLNHLLERGDGRFHVDHPAEEVGRLATVTLGDSGESTVSFAHDRDGYAAARTAVRRTHSDRAADDLPEADALLQAVMASGVAPVPNSGALTTFLDRYGDPDLMAGHPPVFAGFDTNLLPWRVDRLLGLRRPDAGIGYVNGFVLATGVRDELDWGSKCHDTDPYVAAFGDACEEYWNQPVGSARISRLGLAAYREIRDIQQAIEIDCDRGDESIVSAYADWQSSARGRIVLFSNDREFVERARSMTVLAERVELPSDLPDETTATWREIEELLYQLTVLFGVLELPGVTLHGVWRGKEGLDWQHERLELDARSPPLASALERDREIVSAYESARTG